MSLAVKFYEVQDENEIPVIRYSWGKGGKKGDGEIEKGENTSLTWINAV